MLELKEVTRRVAGVDHLLDVSMRLEPGVMNVLLGQARAGKTSLMRVMAGLDRPGEGTLWFDGIDVTGKPVARRNVAMVYQQFVNYPAMTVFENIASPLRLAKCSRPEIEKRVGEAAELLKLTPYLGRKPLNLSGGQHADQLHAQRRLAAKRGEKALAGNGDPGAGRQSFDPVNNLRRWVDADHVTRENVIHDLAPAVLQALVAECPAVAQYADRPDFIALQKKALTRLQGPGLLSAGAVDAEFQNAQAAI